MKYLKNCLLFFLKKISNQNLASLICKLKPSFIYLYRGKNVKFRFNKYFNNININVSSDDLSIKTTMIKENQDIIIAMQRFLKKNDIVVDIGANIGAFALVSSKIVGDHGRVYCYEPSNDSYTKISLNIELNKEFAHNIILKKKAIGEKNKKGFLIDDEVQGNYLLIDSINNKNRKLNAKLKKKSQVVQISTLDNEFNKSWQPIKLIKIDAEGYEYKVLLGAKNIIKDFSPIIIIERNSDVYKIKKFLSIYNYVFYNLYDDGKLKKVRNNIFITKNFLAKREANLQGVYLN
jgi:FkbM family methyltransferase